jgi:serine/threonine-protein kinase RsbW
MEGPRQEVLRIRASYAFLAKLREFVRHAGLTVGLSETERDSIVLAIDEAATNIIAHAARQHEEAIDCCCFMDESGQELVCELVYDAEDLFDPINSPSEEAIRQRVREFRRGGYGVFLMHNLVDTVEYRREGQKNIIRLSKKHHLGQ